jgi:hypothetical protein
MTRHDDRTQQGGRKNHFHCFDFRKVHKHACVSHPWVTDTVLYLKPNFEIERKYNEKLFDTKNIFRFLEYGKISLILRPKTERGSRSAARKKSKTVFTSQERHKVPVGPLRTGREPGENPGQTRCRETLRKSLQVRNDNHWKPPATGKGRRRGVSRKTCLIS